jgi:hypothetical protein
MVSNNILKRKYPEMAKKFFTVLCQNKKYRALFDDISLIIKRGRKIRPSLPAFTDRDRPNIDENYEKPNSEKID